jgi:hypothetical protein
MIAPVLGVMAMPSLPDQNLVLAAMAVGAAVAAVAFRLCALLWFLPRPARASLGWALGVGAGFLAGAWYLSPPRWLPGEEQGWLPGEGQDRLLLVLIPAAVLVEVLAGLPRVPRWVGWVLRVLVALAAARVMLHGSTWLEGQDGVPARWMPQEQWLWLGGLSAGLAVVWCALALLAPRAPDRSVPVALLVAVAGASAAIMFSKSITIGQLALQLVAALAATTLASEVLRRRGSAPASVGVGVVGLFGLLATGHFFAELTDWHAAAIFLSLLLCWLPELPGIRRLPLRLRGALRVALVCVPLAVVVLQAQRQYEKDSQATSGEGEPSRSDYENFQGPDPD